MAQFKTNVLKRCKNKRNYEFISVKIIHIFQNGQVTSKLMVHKKMQHFLAQFFMAFHVVSSFFMRVLASETIK